MFEFFDKLFRAKRKPTISVPDNTGTLTDKPAPEPTEVQRLTREVYLQLERECSRLAVGPTTTELQAGYQLGIAAVLEKLRNGIVIGA